MGLYSRFRNVSRDKVKAAEKRYEAEVRDAEDELEAELEGDSPEVRRARERVREMRARAAREARAAEGGDEAAADDATDEDPPKRDRTL